MNFLTSHPCSVKKRLPTSYNTAFKLAGRGLSDKRRPLEVFIHEVNQERKIMEGSRPHPRAQVQSHLRAKA